MKSIFINNLSRKTVLLTGRIHGNEPAGELALLRFAQQQIDGATLTTDGTYISEYNYLIIPRINPEDTRHAGGVDMNRDFPNTKCEIVLDLLHHLADYSFYAHIDCHETLVGEDFEGTGFYLYESGNTKIGEKVLGRMKDLGVSLHPTPLIRVGKGNTAFDGYTKRGFTTESFTSLPIEVRIREQLVAIDSILRYL